MLDERLERFAKIGNRKSIASVARWLSENTTSVDSLKQFAKTTSGINVDDVEPILWLFASMGLLKIVDGNYIEGQNQLGEKYKRGEEHFEEWFIDQFVEFALDNGIIDIDTITYSITENAYVMSSTTIKPKKHACYRNILTEYGAITLLPDAKYLVNNVLDRAIKIPERHKKITEKQLMAKLEAQREQGERGELFVLEYEKKRISDPAKQSLIQRISTIDVAAGFDIVSLNSNDSTSPDRFIEVKTYKGAEHFLWSDNEVDKAKVMGDSYYLYLVDDDCINKEGYDPIIIQNPAKEVFESGNWIFEPDSYRINKLISRPGDKQATDTSGLETDETEAIEEELMPRYVSDSKVFFNKHSYSNTDLLRVFNAMYEMGFFVDEIGAGKATKAEVFRVLGDALHIDLRNASKLLCAAKGVNNDSDANTGLFDKLKKASEDYFSE